MSPDSPHPSATRRAWRFMSALGCILGAGAILCSVVLYTQIQDSRVDSIRSQCVEQNIRHQDTLAAYDRVLLVRLSHVSVDSSVPPGEVTRQLLTLTRRLPTGRRMQVEQARASMAFLMQRLAPRRDCAKRVATLTQ